MIAKKVPCTQCGSTRTRISLLGGSKTGNTIVIAMCLAVIGKNILGMSSDGIVLVVAWIALIAVAAYGLTVPKYKCKDCRQRFDTEE